MSKRGRKILDKYKENKEHCQYMGEQMKNNFVQRKKIVRAFLVSALLFALVLLLFIGLFGGEKFTLADTLTTYVITKNADGTNYDVNTSDGAVIATSVAWNEVITEIDQAVSSGGESKKKIQLGNGIDVLDIENDFLELSNGEYHLSGKLRNSGKQGVRVGVGAEVVTAADIESVSGYGIANNGVLIVEGGTLSSQQEVISGNGKITVRGNPSFEVKSLGLSMIRTSLGNEIIDGGYIGSTVINMFIDSLNINSPNPATFVIVKKTDGVNVPDVNKWRLLNQNFDLVSSTYEDSSKGSLISKKFYMISYILKSNLPPVYLGGYKPIEKAYPGENVKLPTRCEISLTGDILNYSLHGWYEEFDGNQPDPYIGTPINEIKSISRNWTVYAKFSDAPPSPPPCPKPLAPLMFTYNANQNGYVVVGMDKAVVSSFANTHKSNLLIAIPTSFDDGINGIRQVVAIGENAFKASDYIGYTFTSLEFEQGSKLTSIGASAFEGCDSLTGNELIIPSGIERIGERAFYGAGKGYKGSLIIPSSMMQIGEYAFYNYNGQNGTLKLSSEIKLTQISNYTFYGCNFGGTLIIPNSVTHIGVSAFSFSKSYRGRLVLPALLESVANSAFASSGNFNGALTLPNSLKTIGASAFSTISKFNTIYLPNNVATTYDYTVFGSSSVAPIIVAASKTLYDIYKSGQNNLTAYPTLTYETIVTFVESGGNFLVPSKKAQTKLFGYNLFYHKDASGIWADDSSYVLPVIARSGYTFLKYQTVDGMQVKIDTAVFDAPIYTATWLIDSPIVSIITDSFTRVYSPTIVSNLRLRVSNAVSGLTYLYEWYKGGVKISGASTLTYDISTVIDSGSYSVKVKVIDNEGLSSDWILSSAKNFTIERATFDLANRVSFSDKVVKEDGSIHALILSGVLPHGLSVSYAGTNGYTSGGVSSVGIYTVTATFTVSDIENYYTPNVMTATLTINIPEITSGTTDGKTTVTIGGENGLTPGTTLSIEDKGSDEYADKKFVIGNNKHSSLQAIEINLLLNGENTQLGGLVTVRLLIKENLRDYENLKILYIASDGSAHEMHATRDGDYFVFSATDMRSSIYVVTIAESVIGLGAILGIAAGALAVVSLSIVFIVCYTKNKRRK